jgi:hypothetical protein
MNELANKRAFPCASSPIDNNSDGQSGMTYRQWLAGLAMQGFVTQLDPGFIRASEPVPPWYAKRAVEMADALIAELERKPEA